jgi:dTDP-4-dehydrorhamnose reductase
MEQINDNQIIFTGGSGLLGSEFRKLMPESDYPSMERFDVTNYQQMEDYLRNRNFKILVHAAALISPPKIEKEPMGAIETNIIGTANVAKLCSRLGIKLIYISTDYVFKGDKGNYSEEDPVLPVNKYAWSKLGGECAVRLLDNYLIIRTTFGSNIFPYEKAFTDQWTSREGVSVIAKKIIFLLKKDITGVIHVGGKRKTVFDYAMSLDGNRKIEKISIKDVDFKVPVDTSLNSSRYDSIVGDSDN